MESVRWWGFGILVVCEYGIGTGARRAGVHGFWAKRKVRSAGATAGTVKNFRRGLHATRHTQRRPGNTEMTAEDYAFQTLLCFAVAMG